MMKVSEVKRDEYVFQINGRILRLDKEMVDRYSRFICPVDEKYVDYLIRVFGRDGSGDNILSCRIALSMTDELLGYGYAG